MPGRGRRRGLARPVCSVLLVPKRSLAEFPGADAFPRSEDAAEVGRVAEAPARPDACNGSVSQPWVREGSERVVESAVEGPFCERHAVLFEQAFRMWPGHVHGRRYAGS